MGLTQALCDTISSIGFDDLSPEVIEAGRRAVLDGVAVGLAGTTEQAPRIAAEHVRSLGGHERSTLIGFDLKASPVQAAFVNGMSIHVLDYEAMWSPPTHTTSPCLPTALALAESEGRTGRDVIAAFVKGCEVQGRLRLASKVFVPHDLIFHPPGVVGVIGSAVAAAHMLDLSPLQLRHAIGLAASRAGSLIGNAGTMTKCTHCGTAASMGLDSALLARRGFTANPDILEATKGFATAFFEKDYDPQALLDFGKPWRLVDPGLAIKMYPAQYGTNFCISAALDCSRQLGPNASIRSVHIHTPMMGYVDKPFPGSGLDGKFSFQYTAAVALLDGKVNIASFTDARRFRPDIDALLQKTRLQQDPAIPDVLEKMHVEITVELEDGRRVRARCDGPPGYWGKPPLTRAQHRVKIDDCFATRMAQAQAGECIGLLESLESLDAQGVRELMRQLGSPRPH